MVLESDLSLLQLRLLIANRNTNAYDVATELSEEDPKYCYYCAFTGCIGDKLVEKYKKYTNVEKLIEYLNVKTGRKMFSILEEIFKRKEFTRETSENIINFLVKWNLNHVSNFLALFSNCHEDIEYISKYLLGLEYISVTKEEINFDITKNEILSKMDKSTIDKIFELDVYNDLTKLYDIHGKNTEAVIIESYEAKSDLKAFVDEFK